jgi:dGTPase
MLLACACRPEQSRGRLHAEPPAPPDAAFQSDRDRIVHCTAFRRLVYKTQVFLNHEGDLFRTRLTHSLEVGELGRLIARRLGLNEDLIEAIALAHDLGHTPFGHAGQDALHRCMREADPAGGGFEHNLQSLRVVDRLEERYPAFDGLNLSFETREGILKRCSRVHARRLVEREPGGVAQRFLDDTRPSLEAQLCNLVDEMAYNLHDIDDGVRSGLLALEQLDEIELYAHCRHAALAAYPQLAGRRLLFETLRRMLSLQVDDVVAASRAALDAAMPDSVDAVRRLPVSIRFGDAMQRHVAALKLLLRDRLYRHPQVVATTDRARHIVAVLFDAYRSDPGEIPGRAAQRPRDVADYIAGMTDRYASREYERLTGDAAFD